MVNRACGLSSVAFGDPRLRAWPGSQPVSGQGAKRSLASRANEDVSGQWKENRNYRKFTSREVRRVAVNGRCRPAKSYTAERRGRRPGAPPAPSPQTVLVLAGRPGCFFSFSHTFAGGKVLADVWKRNLIYCGKKKPTLEKPRVLIINFYSEYNLFAHE